MQAAYDGFWCAIKTTLAYNRVKINRALLSEERGTLFGGWADLEGWMGEVLGPLVYRKAHIKSSLITCDFAGVSCKLLRGGPRFGQLSCLKK